MPHPDDEMRIYSKSGNFLFKSMSKITSKVDNNKHYDALSISAWE